MNNSNELFIKKHQVLTYELKPGTKSSFYQKEGRKDLLPERIGFSKDGFLKIANTGRAIVEKRVGQIVGTFKKNEISPYKKYKPFSIFSTVWETIQFPSFVGYGDIGLTNEAGRTVSSKDLFILYSPSKEVLEIHLFPGLVEFKDLVLQYLRDHKKQKP